MAEQPEALSRTTESSALAELLLCENLAQISGWAARWSAQVTRADGALLWAPDAVHPLFLCIGSYGDEAGEFAKRTARRDHGLLKELLTDRGAISVEGPELAGSTDPLLRGLPKSFQAALAVPLEAEGLVVGLLILLFHERPRAAEALTGLSGFLHMAAPALGRAMRAERKTVGMLHAIERLTNLYDLSKAFGSTIDLTELNAIIVRKAVDFAVAEVGSLWLLSLEGGDAAVVLAATSVNENYEVENAPDAVGGSAVGDLIAEKRALWRNSIPPHDPLAGENERYPIRSILAFPLVEEDRPVGALVLVNKRGRHPDFSAEDEELLQDLARQAVRALRNARQYEAEKKVEELDALLAVSREITATLDLDKVMQKIVNATAALIAREECAIAILDRGKVRLGALSGVLKLDRKNPKVQTTEELLEWVFSSGTDMAVNQEEDGQIRTDRPETEEKFRAYFSQTGFRSFYGLLLKDEEGKLGVLAFLGSNPLSIDEGKRDLLAILVNQATVAVRNAQLYKQVTLPSFLKTLVEKQRQLAEMPRPRRLVWGIGALLFLILLLVVPWRLRVAGPARVLPGHRAAVTAGVDGTVASVLRHEGDTVAAGEVIATLDPPAYVSAVADARAAYQIADSEVAKYRETGDSAAMFQAQSRLDEMKAKLALEEDRLARTTLRSPVAGMIVTPRIEERVGQFLTKGSEFCVVADVGTVTAEVAVPESDASLIRAGEPVVLKLNPYPTRLFRGTVSRPGSHVREEERERFVVAEVQIENPAGLLMTGMQGKAKVSTIRVPIGVAVFRKPARYFWTKLWAILP